MRTTTVILAGALSAIAVAAPHEGHNHDETVNLFLPMADKQSILAYEIGSDATATTYAAGCPSGADSNDCGIPTGFIYTGSANTVKYTMGNDDYG